MSVATLAEVKHRMDSEGFEVGKVTVTGSTDKGLWVEREGEQEFYPFSQIHDDSEVYSTKQKGETGLLVISQWLATERGLV